jgi:FAD/FMN-containing dehydrogenase
MVEIATIDNKKVSIDDTALQNLKSSVQGEVLSADDNGYDEARGIFNAMIDKSPALVVQCAGSDDVIHCVNFARENRLLTAIRGGGHGIAGNAVCDDGMMIHLGNMNGVRVNGVRVDADKRVAWVEGGATLADLDEATAPYNLACPVGVVSRTGVAGLTTGGGYGWLRQKYGMSIDSAPSKSSRRTASSVEPANRRIRTCSGRSAGAVATSAS